MQHAELINSIIRYLECKPDLLVRVPCVYCGNGKVLVLDPTTGQFQCQVCGKHGRLDDLAVLAADQFERRHHDIVKLMETDGVIKRERGR